MMIIFSPLIVGGFLSIYWLRLCIFGKIQLKYAFDRLFITILITLTYFISPIINALADYVNCTEINNNLYITNYLLIQCNNNHTYFIWGILLVFPSFLIYGVGLPLTAYFYMMKNRNQLFKQSIIEKINFLLNGYSTQTFYWYFFLFQFYNF